MPANKGEILALVYGCIDDINDLRLPEEIIEKRPDVLLAHIDGQPVELNGLWSGVPVGEVTP